MLKATVRAWWLTVVNITASILPDDPFTSRLRAYLYGLISFRSGKAPTVKGGCRVNGYGLRIGHRVFINRSCYFDLSAPILLGDNVVVGHHTVFVTADHEIGAPGRRAGAVKAAPIVVEEGAWIGCQCVIMPGVTIGRGSVVAAGALVRENVPPNAMVAGVPARVKTHDLDAAVAAR